MPRVLSDRAQEMLEMYPPFLREDATLQAVCAASAAEFETLYMVIDALERNTFPQTANEFVQFFEFMLGLRIDSSQPMSTRVDAVIVMLRGAAMGGSSKEWVEIITRIMGGGWLYEIQDPDHNVLVVRMPFAEGSPQAQIAEALIIAVTPAVMEIHITWGEGFILDESLLDVDTF